MCNNSPHSERFETVNSTETNFQCTIPIKLALLLDLVEHWLPGIAEGGPCAYDIGAMADLKERLQTVIFVCTSNTCRSTMAMGLARRWYAETLGVAEDELESKAGIHVRSGGLSHDWEPEGSPANPNSQLILKRDFGIDLSAHSSRILVPADIEGASAIYGMTSKHVDTMRAMAPAATCPIKTLGVEIPDPWHEPLAVYEETAKAITAALPGALASDLEALRKSGEGKM